MHKHWKFFHCCFRCGEAIWANCIPICLPYFFACYHHPYSFSHYHPYFLAFSHLFTIFLCLLPSSISIFPLSSIFLCLFPFSLSTLPPSSAFSAGGTCQERLWTHWSWSYWLRHCQLVPNKDTPTSLCIMKPNQIAWWKDHETLSEMFCGNAISPYDNSQCGHTGCYHEGKWHCRKTFLKQFHDAFIEQFGLVS